MIEHGHDDVRMRGFRARADLDAVVAWVDALPAPLGGERVSAVEASGRVLAEAVVSTVDVPAFRRSAMDGWALRGEATFGVAPDDPRVLDVVGQSLPGAPFAGVVGAGEAVRIMTGAPVPDGADAVLRAEDGHETSGRLEVIAPVPPGKNVSRVAEDVCRGARLLDPGRRLRPQDIALALSVGQGELGVIRRPVVGIVVTGDELLRPGEVPDGAHIVDSNGPMLNALALRDGAGEVVLRRIGDTRASVSEALHATPGDVLLVSGGTSVGQEDHAPRVVAEEGELAFHGIAVRPASPTGVGRIEKRPVFLLPGNPVSCLSAYDFLAGRAVRRLGGRSPSWPYRCTTRPLGRRITSVLGRVDYVRVGLPGDTVEPLMSRGASILSSTTQADGFVVVPKDSEGYAEGEPIDVWLYDL